MIPAVLSTLTGSLLIIAGLIGCIAPVLPGPPVAFVSLILVFPGRIMGNIPFVADNPAGSYIPGGGAF